ncbi:MAG: helix-turn-helix domain-containing GNAT family N-acetyltransferase [Planctomycetota bacterium]
MSKRRSDGHVVPSHRDLQPGRRRQPGTGCVASTPAATDAAAAQPLQDQVRRTRVASREVVRELGFLRGNWRGLTASQCHALIELGARGGLSGAQLAQVLVLDKSTTSRALGPLLRRRLVRASVDLGDRRSKRYALTATGRSHVGRVHESCDAEVVSALSLLGEAERQEVVRGLELYARALRRARARAGLRVRRLRRADNPAVAAVIRTVMPEFGAVGPGFAILDPEVDDMFGAYRGKAAYFVAEGDGVVLGGAGIGPLTGADADVCVLKKMYLLLEGRGLGLGHALLETVLQTARELGYRRCYLETLGHMSDARRLYERNGFEARDKPMGQTGHFGCNTYYVREL